MFTLSQIQGPARDALNLIMSSPAVGRDKYALCLSRVLADKLALPSSQVDNIDEFYGQTNSLRVDEVISNLNELMVVDIQLMRRLIRNFWMMRYSIAFPGNPQFGSCSADPVGCFIGYEFFVSPDLIARIREVQDVQSVLNDCRLVIDALSQVKR